MKETVYSPHLKLEKCCDVLWLEYWTAWQSKLSFTDLSEHWGKNVYFALSNSLKLFLILVFSYFYTGPNQSGYGSNWNWNMPQNGPAAQGGPPAAGAPGPQGKNIV